MKIYFHKIIFVVCLITSIGLIVGGFFAPPTGTIDGSVLTAVGELFGFATLGMIPTILRDRKVQLTHGSTTLKIQDEDAD